MCLSWWETGAEKLKRPPGAEPGGLGVRCFDVCLRRPRSEVPGRALDLRPVADRVGGAVQFRHDRLEVGVGLQQRMHPVAGRRRGGPPLLDSFGGPPPVVVVF